MDIAKILLVIGVAAVYTSFIFLLSRAMFPVPEPNCQPMDEKCWQSYQDLSSQSRARQGLFSLAGGLIGIGMAYFMKKKEARMALLLGSVIPILSGSGITDYVWIGAGLAGLSLLLLLKQL